MGRAAHALLTKRHGEQSLLSASLRTRTDAITAGRVQLREASSTGRPLYVQPGKLGSAPPARALGSSPPMTRDLQRIAIVNRGEAAMRFLHPARRPEKRA